MKKLFLGCILLISLITIGCGEAHAPKQAEEKAEKYPDLVVMDFEITALTKSSINYSWTITNTGDKKAKLNGPTDDDDDNVSVQAVLSDDMVFDPDVDLVVGESMVKGKLTPGELMTVTLSADVALDLASTPYLVVMVDPGDLVDESNEDNNTYCVEIPSLVMPDLEVTDLYVTNWGEDFITYDYTITNKGDGAVNLDETENLTVQAVLSGDNRFNAHDTEAGSELLDASLGNLAPGESVSGTITANVTVDLEATPFLILNVDPTGVVVESDETNNILAAYLEEQGIPDLQVTALEVTSWTPESISCSYTITNNGTGAAILTGTTDTQEGGVAVQGYLSMDTILDMDGDTGLDPVVLGPSAPDELAAGESFDGSFTLNTLVDGVATPNLIVMVDCGEQVAESNEGNNTRVAELGAEAAPDLEVTSLDIIKMKPNRIRFRYTITNVGQVDAHMAGSIDESSDAVTVLAVLSADQVIDGGDTFISERSMDQSLIPGESISSVMWKWTHIDTDVTPYLIFKVDSGESIEESDEINNTWIVNLQ